MATDWAAVSALGVGVVAFAGTWYQARRGAASSDEDNRFNVLRESVQTLERENKRLKDEAADAEARYDRQDKHIIRQDDEVIILRQRHREAVEQLADCQYDLGDRERMIAIKDRHIAALQAELAQLRGGNHAPSN